jgi:hypothetical protein
MHSRSRLTVERVLAAALSVSALVLAGGQQAWAAGPSPFPPMPTDTITIMSPVTVTALGGTGGEQLSVTADSTTPLVSMTVHLDNATTGYDTLDPTMSPPAGGAQAGTSTWTSATLTPAVLPLGSYFITVDASDAGGTTVTGFPVNAEGPYGPEDALAFQDTPQITPSPGDYVLSYANQHPVIAGTVTELAPGATEPTPYAGQPVVLNDPVEGDTTLTTSSTGGYSETLSHPVAGESITVAVSPTAATGAATAAPVTLSARSSPVRLTAKLSATKITYGKTVKVTGTVGYASGSSVVPLSGQRVQIYASHDKHAATALTTASGTFSATLPREAASLNWTVQADGAAYLSAATVTLPMTVDLPTVITGFRASLNSYWQASFHGCLSLVPKAPGYVASLSGLVIQYSAGPHGPWHTLGAVPGQRSSVCGNGGRTFSAVLPAPLNYAYYRASFGGAGTRLAGASTNAPATGFLPSASGTSLAWKYEDRITGFTVSTRTVNKGGKLTVSGKLQYYLGGKWRDLPHRVVQIILLPNGSRTWYWIAKITTNAKGQFTATFMDPVTATWSAEYLGDSEHLAAVAAMIPVAIRGTSAAARETSEAAEGTSEATNPFGLIVENRSTP